MVTMPEATRIFIKLSYLCKKFPDTMLITMDNTMFDAFWNLLGWNGEAIKTPPVIGISGGNADSASVRAIFTQIQSAGAIPIFLGNHKLRNASEDIKKIDALVVMGNNADIDPDRYGATRHEKTKSESDTAEGKARADYEYALMQEAIHRKMPLLGVCGGMQRLNVLMGGTLNQHIPDILGHDDHAQHEHNIAPFTPVQIVTIDPSSTLGAISSEVSAVYTPTHTKAPLAHIAENSMHHQAVETVGNGLRVSAICNEGDKNGNPVSIVEAIEAAPNGPFKDQFMVGVQWHPEFSASPLGKYIAERITKEASTFAQAHNRVHPMTEAIEENKRSMLPMIKDVQNPQIAIGGMTSMILQRRNDMMKQSTQLSA